MLVSMKNASCGVLFLFTYRQFFYEAYKLYQKKEKRSIYRYFSKNCAKKTYEIRILNQKLMITGISCFVIMFNPKSKTYNLSIA